MMPHHIIKIIAFVMIILIIVRDDVGRLLGIRGWIAQSQMYVRQQIHFKINLIWLACQNVRKSRIHFAFGSKSSGSGMNKRNNSNKFVCFWKNCIPIISSSKIRYVWLMNPWTYITYARKRKYVQHTKWTPKFETQNWTICTLHIVWYANCTQQTDIQIRRK